MRAKFITGIILFVLFLIFVIGNAAVRTEINLWYFKTFTARTIVVTLVIFVISVIIGWLIPSPLRKRKVVEEPRPKIEKEGVTKPREPEIKKEEKKAPTEGE